MKGFVFTGNYALSRNASIGVLWNSIDQIAGPPLSGDVFMLDFKLKF
jgi:hypothetical protein